MKQRAVGKFFSGVFFLLAVAVVSQNFHAMALAAGTQNTSASNPPTGRFANGKEAFLHLHRVAVHPRCANCHGTLVNGKHIPTVGDRMVPHPMNVQASLVTLGMTCTTCHQRTNFAKPGMPPGAANDRMPGFLWQMPPASMIVNPIPNPRELCQLWTDPTKNARSPGGRGSLTDLKTFRKEFMHHVEDDPLIHWAFNPGPGRTPAPGDLPTLIDAMNTWVTWLEAGNTCASL